MRDPPARLSPRVSSLPLGNGVLMHERWQPFRLAPGVAAEALIASKTKRYNGSGVTITGARGGRCGHHQARPSDAPPSLPAESEAQTRP